MAAAECHLFCSFIASFACHSLFSNKQDSHLVMTMLRNRVGQEFLESSGKKKTTKRHERGRGDKENKK